MSTTAAPMTVDEFLKLPEVEGEKMELIHGEVVSMAYAGFLHERVKSNLIKILSAWLGQNPFGQVFALFLSSMLRKITVAILERFRHTDEVDGEPGGLVCRERQGTALDISESPIVGGQFLAHVDEGKVHEAASGRLGMLLGGSDQARADSGSLAFRLDCQ